VGSFNLKPFSYKNIRLDLNKWVKILIQLKKYINLIRGSFSYSNWVEKIKFILKEYLDTSKLNINTKLKFEDLINSANGSPKQLLTNIEILNDFSDEILIKLNSPIKNSLEILEISKLISEKLEIYQQICLVNLIQTIWWRKTKNISLIKKLENLNYFLRKKIQPRLAWEITFLKISMEDK